MSAVLFCFILDIVLCVKKKKKIVDKKKKKKKNYQCSFVHTVKIHEDQCCFRQSLFLFMDTHSGFPIHYKNSDEKKSGQTSHSL